jgi:hypothetical protein
VTALRREYQRSGAGRRGLVDLDVLAREQEQHHLNMTLLRCDHQRRGPVRRALVDLDVFAREQEPHHVGPPEERRRVKRREASFVGLVHIAPLAEQPRHELRVAGLSCGH